MICAHCGDEVLFLVEEDRLDEEGDVVKVEACELCWENEYGKEEERVLAELRLILQEGVDR